MGAGRGQHVEGTTVKENSWWAHTVFLGGIVFLLVVNSILLFFCGTVFSRTDTTTDQETLFARIAQSAAEIESIRGEFLQERKISGVQKELISRGTFYYKKPDRLRWEQREPIKAGFIVNGKRLKKWRGQEPPQAMDIRKDRGISAFAEQVFAWSRADFDLLRKRYTITVLDPQLPILKLVPLADEERRFVQSITISFTRPGEIRMVEIREKDDDFLRISFTKTVLNGSIDQGLF